MYVCMFVSMCEFVFMYVMCVSVYIHTNTYTYIHAYIHTYAQFFPMRCAREDIDAFYLLDVCTYVYT